MLLLKTRSSLFLGEQRKSVGMTQYVSNDAFNRPIMRMLSCPLLVSQGHSAVHPSGGGKCSY